MNNSHKYIKNPYNLQNKIYSNGYLVCIILFMYPNIINIIK